MKKLVFFLSILLCVSVLFISCDKDNSKDRGVVATTEKVTPMDISSIDVFEYISIGEYKGMTVEYKGTDTDKKDALWAAILDNTSVIKYPDQQVDYYYNQIKAQYIYIAQSNNDTYENVLEYVGVTEEGILAEARCMAVDDLVREAILELESIELTEVEKSDNYDVYVRTFTEMYGYTEEYVRNRLTEELYDTMLYDKMMEKLVLMNEFVVVE